MESSWLLQLYRMKNVRGNARVNTSEKAIFPEALRENIAKKYQNQVFQSWLIKDRLVKIWRAFIPEKQMNLNKNNKMGGESTCPSAIPAPLLCVHLENQTSTSRMKTGILVSLDEADGARSTKKYNFKTIVII